MIREYRYKDEHWSEADQCGACHKHRINYDQIPYEFKTYPGRSIDQYEDFSNWDMDDHRDKVRLVRAFDQACDELRMEFITLLTQCEV
ncbi:MAG: hypothetical protein KZQ89_00380 [Candidatus Thiodiazotropha sp. (ex Lucinoma kastoroae)]|nr:hypothetical protein [Candidatus Thiodiazotropha sp. (ex Rostrolucina anterorostrata)]MCU7846460.1 hypothetical protein [Candidatus Thiodiazotropha sp. (ex Lucinoma kastoroae)]